MKNIILLLWDNIRFDHTCLSSYERETTPFLRTLLPNSIVFTQAIATGFWSIPSIFSIFTGKEPWEHNLTMETCLGAHGCGKNPNRMLTEDLKDLGYTTWGFVDTNWFGPNIGFKKGFRVLHEHARRGRADMRGMVKDVQRIFSPRKEPNSPFFLYLNPLDAAAPYPSPADMRQWTKKGRDQQSTYVSRYFVEGWYRGWTDTNYQWLRDRYDDAILDLDRVTGELWDWLLKEGHLDNTIVFIASDHGEFFGEHNFYHHTAGLYDAVLRVPLVIWPSSERQLISDQFSMRHLHTLIMQVAKGNTLDPVSLTSEHLVIRSPVPQRIINDFRKLRADYDHSHLFSAKDSIRTTTWKVIKNSRVDDELYDLAIDPQETKNIFHPDDPRVREAEAILGEI